MRSSLLIGGLLLAGLGISLATSDAWERIDALEAELAALEAQNDGLRRENNALARRAELLRTQPEALEQVARQEYGLVHPVEWILRLDDSGSGR